MSLTSSKSSGRNSRAKSSTSGLPRSIRACPKSRCSPHHPHLRLAAHPRTRRDPKDRTGIDLAGGPAQDRAIRAGLTLATNSNARRMSSKLVGITWPSTRVAASSRPETIFARWQSAQAERSSRADWLCDFRGTRSVKPGACTAGTRIAVTLDFRDPRDLPDCGDDGRHGDRPMGLQ